MYSLLFQNFSYSTIVEDFKSGEKKVKDIIIIIIIVRCGPLQVCVINNSSNPHMWGLY
jgi:hypothetical protein